MNRAQLDRTVKMADMTESPPLFDTNETKLDDLEDDDEDIFASAMQVYRYEYSKYIFFLYYSSIARGRQFMSTYLI